MTASWTGRVEFNETGGAYHPRRILLHREDLEAARVHIERRFPGRVRQLEEARGDRPFLRFFCDAPILTVVDDLRAARVRAQPDHVLFADAGLHGNPFSGNPFSGNPFSGNPFSGNPFSGNPFSGNPFSGNPFSGNPFSGNPFSGNPFSGNPFSGNPFSGNPFSGNPFSGNPFSGVAYGTPDLLRDRAFATTGQGPNLARPADPLVPGDRRPGPGGWPTVAVLDVGLPARTDAGAPSPWLPHLLQDCEPVGSDASTGQPTAPPTPEVPQPFLDRVAGHGMFVAGVIGQAFPGCALSVYPVLDNAGDGSESAVVDALKQLILKDGEASVDIVNLSFGGYEVREMEALAEAIRSLQLARGPASRMAGQSGWTVHDDDHGVVVVASAGNDASPIAPYPAGLPGVVSVAALGPLGPAAFTNYGLWVRACAAGVDVRSTFFESFSGPTPLDPTGDPDNFTGAATWSGTSFAAPFVAGKIARVAKEQRILPKRAVARLLDAPGLARLPGLGTIVTA